MSRKLSIVRLRTVSHEQGWHWSLRLDAIAPATGVTFFDASMGFGWAGFKQRERPYSSIESAMKQLPIVDESPIGEIAENAVESALKTLRTCPVSKDDAWNCQNWARECVKQLYDSGDIQEENYNAFCAWNDRVLAKYNVARPGTYFAFAYTILMPCSPSL